MFTPIETGIGALLLLQSTTTLLLTTGRPLGASGILGTALTSPDLHNLPLLGGMLAAGAATARLAPHLLPDTAPLVGTRRYLLAALLVGAGTRAANGCTSGHLLCGVPRLSARSLVASATFFAAAAATATLASFLAGDGGGDGGALACGGGSVPCSTPAYPAAATTAALLQLLLATAAVSAVALLLPAGRAARALAAFWAGATFALGLAVSGMAGAAKPLGFLTFRRALWDPSLGMVVVGAVLPAMVAWRRAVRMVGAPTAGGEWAVGRADVGARLVAGSVLFGVGWGLAGVCPGPAVVGMAVSGVAWAWAGAFWAGWGAAGWVL